MAVYERRYQRVTKEGLEKCIRWCQNYLNLRDWHVELYIGSRDKGAPSTGWTVIDWVDAYHCVVELWIDMNKCKEKDINPYVAACHEMIHVLVMGKCHIGLDVDSDNDEYINYAFQDLLYGEFCAGSGVKKVGLKEL
ncbi:MAG: hypothetical protein IMZ53_02855 [Thermoplasmata archaeon]|nr:hypothetical protein [Thermoplasmata archaeon]